MDNELPPELTEPLTQDEIVYWMGWHMNSQQRIYDVLLALLAVEGASGQAKALQEMHSRGEFLYPPPGMGDDTED